VQSNLIFGNSSDNQGGGFARCDGMILNNTICGNSAALLGGGLYSCKGTTANCILWGNAAAESGNEIYDSTTPSFCCITDWTEGGTGNIKDPPLFADTKGEDFHLLVGSLCIDAGENSLLTAPGVDMDGNLRIARGEGWLKVDMGAYEFNSPPFVVTGIGLNEKGDGRITWSSQPNDTYTVWTCVDPSTGLWVKEKKVDIPSQGTSTSWTFSIPLEGRRLYRLRMK